MTANDVAQDGFDTGAKGTGGDLKPSVNFNGGTTHVISEDEDLYIAEDFDFQCGCDNDDCEYAADPEDGRG